MIQPSEFFNCLQENGITFFSGVPDSLLKHICAYITDNTRQINISPVLMKEILLEWQSGTTWRLGKFR